MRAAERHEPKLVALLLEHGADPKCKDTYNEQTALHYSLRTVPRSRFVGTQARDAAAVQRQKDAIEALKATMDLLLSHGVEVNGAGRDGETPLLMASEQLSLEAVHLLLDKGAAVNAQDKLGMNCLIHAVLGPPLPSLHRGSGEVSPAVREQLRAEVPVRLSVLELLVNHGARVLAPDKQGQTALDWLRPRQEPESLNLLEQAALAQ